MKTSAVTKEEAGLFISAHNKTMGAKASFAEVMKAVADMKTLTTDQMEKLEVVPALNTNDYILFLVNDTSGAEPVCILWAYAEKLTDESGFLFSCGTGSNADDMAIQACAMLNYRINEEGKGLDYQYGGELEDKNGEVSVKSDLTDEQFASRITDIVKGDGGGKARMAIAATEDRINELAEEGGGFE